MGYDDESSGDEEEEPEVLLGFASDVCEPELLLRNQFPSKLGGAPSWLDPVNLPTSRQLTCAASGKPLRFVAQLYAASSDEPHAFHRSIYLFISPDGSALSRPGAVRAFRCQLPRENAFYPYEPPEADERPRGLTPAEARLAAARAPAWAEPAADAALVDPAATAAYHEHELYTEPEPADDEAAEAAVREDDRVRQLLTDYQKQAEGATEGYGAGSGGSGGEGGAEEEGEEEKEKEAPKKRIVDEDDEEEAKEDVRAQDPRVREFGTFTARLARAPEQCIRYCFDEGATPLWAAKAGRAPQPVPPCHLCGGPRRFELQLMPQSLHFLGVDSAQDDAPDFTTIAIYTCASSCAVWPGAGRTNGSADREAGAPRGESEGEGGADRGAAPFEGWEELGVPASAAVGEALAGRRVCVRGLQGRAELNGCSGTVLSWHAPSARWAVELDPAEGEGGTGSTAEGGVGEGSVAAEAFGLSGGGGERLRLRPANLAPLEAAAEPAIGGYAEEYVWVQLPEC